MTDSTCLRERGTPWIWPLLIFDIWQTKSRVKPMVRWKWCRSAGWKRIYPCLTREQSQTLARQQNTLCVMDWACVVGTVVSSLLRLFYQCLPLFFSMCQRCLWILFVRCPLPLLSPFFVLFSVIQRLPNSPLSDMLVCQQPWLPAESMCSVWVTAACHECTSQRLSVIILCWRHQTKRQSTDISNTWHSKLTSMSSSIILLMLTLHCPVSMLILTTDIGSCLHKVSPVFDFISKW